MLRTVRDVLIWVVLAVPVVVGGLVPFKGTDWRWWVALAGVGIIGAAVFGRMRPRLALLLMLALTVVQGNFAFAVPVMAYLTGRRGDQVRSVVWLFAAVCVGGTALNLLRGIDVTRWFPLTIWLVLLGVLPWLAGRYRKQYGELVRAGWDRVEQLEREQRIVAERERLRERARIAQDMHDSLGHELALIAVRAGALQVAADLPERHRKEVAELRAGAADATDRLHRIIGLLRNEPDGSLAELVQRAAASGMDVRLVEDGVPVDERAAYRVVREGLTNAAKHAPGAKVLVRVDASSVSVTNGPPSEKPLLSGGGRGLAGLAERVHELRSGETPDGGFEVKAVLARPREEPPDELARRRQQVRRGLLITVAVPAGLLAALSAVMAGYYAYASLNSVLEPADYAALDVGQPQREVERVLPRMDLIGADADRVRSFPPAPAGARCRYFRSDGNPLGLGEVYRLCFLNERLAAKDARTAG
ncbi:sensor histidine kinase [Actinomadura gamaensis]|uniref:histidine kinase n=1 Tax=Actinomadura gamaensis TaxID=1763541 RepID=A0ABV9U9V6_9ACTN